MKNLEQSLTELNQMTIEMVKGVKRSLNITLEQLKLTDFSSELFGEAKVIEEEINEYDIKIDEKCVQLIARYQPAASSLRFIIGIMHMNRDLERIGDQSMSILYSLRNAFKERDGQSKELVPLLEMGEKVLNMYEIFVSGYLTQKIESGYMILGLDDEIDKMKWDYIAKIKASMIEDVKRIELGVENLVIARTYERIADNIVNLAESLVYIYKGEDLRHRDIGGILGNEDINS